ncbi:MAG: DUF2497 domain-containing protein [Alphaproteobacteria bacterium]|nr:DUF2497 domain-containing protein [Alphaproteobacteria bacterium]HPF46087.1 DUF2497 domain-containing protein [Emcibacteraceae bacterium]HRW29907.1 DUF2497 domain-containing protein [Emcibacteraceae bacterium]
MSQPGKEEEPSMEEILASIRRIISEDDDAAPEKSEAGKEETPEVKADAEPEEEEVLELTENDLEEASQDDIDNMFDSVEDSDDELVMEDKEEEPEEQEEEPEPAPEYASARSDDFDIDDVDPAEGKDVLMSEEVSAEIQGRFDALSALLTSGYQGSGNTLEDLVRELLRPMLKKWLEENLPPLAERMVAKEIARLARTKKP